MSEESTYKSLWYSNLCLEYWIIQWHCDIHNLPPSSTGVEMTKEHMFGGTNVQNHHSRTPPVIMALRRRYDWRVMWGRSEKCRFCLLFSISSEDFCRMTLIYVCVSVFVSDVLSIRSCVIAIWPSVHTAVHEWRESLCSAACLDVIYCFSIRKNTIQYVKIRFFLLRRNKVCFVLYSLTCIEMDSWRWKCCSWILLFIHGYFAL